MKYGTAEDVLKATFQLYAEARYTWSGVVKIADHAEQVNASSHAAFFATMQFELSDLSIVRVAKLFDKANGTRSLRWMLKELKRFSPIDDEKSASFLSAYSASDLVAATSIELRVQQYGSRILDRLPADVEAVVTARHKRVAHQSKLAEGTPVSFGNIDAALDVARRVIQLAGAVYYNSNLRPDGTLVNAFYEFPGLYSAINALSPRRES